jgi:hypothetical protein
MLVVLTNKVINKLNHYALSSLGEIKPSARNLRQNDSFMLVAIVSKHLILTLKNDKVHLSKAQKIPRQFCQCKVENWHL